MKKTADAQQNIDCLVKAVSFTLKIQKLIVKQNNL